MLALSFFAGRSENYRQEKFTSHTALLRRIGKIFRAMANKLPFGEHAHDLVLGEMFGVAVKEATGKP